MTLEAKTFVNPIDFPSHIGKESIWKWGSCTSETCNHVSHDPYTEYPAIEISGCQELKEYTIESEKYTRKVYSHSRGYILSIYKECGYHYCPSIKAIFYKSLKELRIGLLLHHN